LFVCRKIELGDRFYFQCIDAEKAIDNYDTALKYNPDNINARLRKMVTAHPRGGAYTNFPARAI